MDEQPSRRATSGDSASGTDWPAVAYEDRSWTSTLDEGHLDVWQRIKFARPYRASVPPQIAAQPVGVSPDTLALASHADAEVARFDAEMAALPVLMPAVLLRTESASSSQIELLTANARNIALAELGLPGTSNADLIVANTRAMRAALDSGDAVTAESILSIHRALLVADDADIAGRWRTAQVWIGSSALSPHDADFVPPHADRVPALVDDLVTFAARDDITPMVHAALTHAQFETIHPFLDGNGRTGRVLVHTVLRAHGITRYSSVPVSAGLLRATDRYFTALTAYRSGDPQPIVVEMSHAAQAAVANGRQLAAELVATRELWRGQVDARSDSAAWRLVDLLVAQPVVNADRVAADLGISTRAARTTIDTLVAADVLTPISDARRGRIWQAPAVLAAMDAFARRAGRRAAGW
jgi:Fic family protein